MVVMKELPLVGKWVAKKAASMVAPTVEMWDRLMVDKKVGMMVVVKGVMMADKTAAERAVLMVDKKVALKVEKRVALMVAHWDR